jgi:lysophospholipase L1-like esterase
MIRTSRRIALLALLAFLTCASGAEAQQNAAARQHWIGTWATAPIAAPNKTDDFAQDRTLREIVHVSVGGPSLRIVLSNEFGASSLTIGGAQVAPSTGQGSIQPGSSVAVTFSGRPGIVIPAGALAVSDPVALKLPALSDLAVSLFVPAQTIDTLTIHSFADATNYEASGDQTAAPTLTEPHQVAQWRFLKGVDVEAPAVSRHHGKNEAAAIVAFGDSITDGAHSSRDANDRWPDVLARRLQADKATADLGVLNEGIGGNRILHDRAGPSALARFDRDVIAQAGVKYLIILEAINDIGAAQNPVNPHDVVSAADLIAAISQMATRAHIHGIKVYGATLTPYVGAKYESPAGEQMRQAVNQWIRSTPELDGVIDFDKATRDPANPGVYLPADDSGDHLHPNDAGYKAMGDAIDLKLFTK